MVFSHYLPVIYGIGIPFLGTVLGAACVFFMKGSLRPKVQRGMMAFAAGVMVAASVWSLLLPSIESSGDYGKLAFVPPVAGFWAGILLLFLIDKITPHLHLGSDSPEGPRVKMKRTTMLALAVTIHNIPEGIAVALPIYHATGKKRYAIWYSFWTGMTEPLGAIIGMGLLYWFLPSACVGFLMAAVIGIMIYIAFDTLLPLSHEYGDWHYSIAGIMSGIIVIWASLLLLNH